MPSKISNIFSDFVNSEKASGIVLIFCTILSMLIANSNFGDGYLHFWHAKADLSFSVISLDYTVEQWINDGLMAIFFLMVGLEIEREFYVGELSDRKNASLPVMAALGGMLVPAAIHFFFNHNTPTQSGIGIPMATDIAFALGVLALLGNRVPAALKVFLAALAIIDDLGAVIVIAVFYSNDLSFVYLSIALSLFLLMLIINRYKIFPLAVYLLAGIVMWYCMMKSGVHATISGVLLAFAIPFKKTDPNNISLRLQQFLHKPVAFIVLPLFALSNTGIVLSGNWLQSFFTNNSLGIIAGLVIGKPIGILLFCWLAIKFKISKLSGEIRTTHLFGAGLLGGIGFTMSIFITNLAFADETLIVHSKIAILTASLTAGILGYCWLSLLKK